MSMAALANAVRQQARMSQSEYALPQFATISSYDPDSHAVKVVLQPVDPEVGEVESNWMPLGTIGVGNGWGFAVGPEIGDQVKVVFEGGDFSSGTIVARIFSVEQQAIPVPPGEIWAVHKTSSYLKFLTNGDVDVNTAGNLSATVAGSLTADVTGTASYTAAAHQFIGPVTMSETLAVAQDITDQTGSENTETMASMRTKYNEHDHEIAEVQTGSSTVTSNTPIPQM